MKPNPNALYGWSNHQSGCHLGQTSTTNSPKTDDKKTAKMPLSTAAHSITTT